MRESRTDMVYNEKKRDVIQSSSVYRDVQRNALFQGYRWSLLLSSVVCLVVFRPDLDTKVTIFW